LEVGDCRVNIRFYLISSFHSCRTFNIVATVFIANECRVRLPPIIFPHTNSISGGRGGAHEE
jgi:hypothetical protein